MNDPNTERLKSTLTNEYKNMALPRILLVDDNPNRIQQFENIFKFLEYHVITTTTEDVIHQQESPRPWAIFVGSCVEKTATTLKALAESAPDVPLILLTEPGQASQLSTAIDHLAKSVLEWPTTFTEVKRLIDKLTPNTLQPTTGADTSEEYRTKAIERLQGVSPAIVTIRKLIRQVSDTEATVLVLGESGTGKEVVARALHDASPRRNKLFVPINCGAIPGELLESELFGHEKGAFTGALNARQGRFEMAEGGTLFLDEIGDMPMTMQVKLLRVLQERTFERVGSNKTIHCDVRIIAATHRSLENEIKENRFREDLFYRLNVFPIEMPALRERPEDIPLLIADLVAKLHAANRGSVRMTAAALAVLMQHEWPGNIRELANLIERLAIIHPQGLVDVTDLPEKFQRYKVPDTLVTNSTLNEDFDDNDNESLALAETTLALDTLNPSNSNPVSHASIVQLPKQGIDLKEYLNIMEIDLIRQALEESNGIVAHAAKRLNMRRTTLVEKLRKYEMQR